MFFFWSLGFAWFTKAVGLLFDLSVTQLPRNHGASHGSSLYWTKISVHTLLIPPSYQEIIRSSTQRSTCNLCPGSSPASRQLIFSTSSQEQIKVAETETKARTATGCLPVARQTMPSSTKWPWHLLRAACWIYFSQSTCYTKFFSRCARTQYFYHIKFDFTTLLTVLGLTTVLE
jgi:hypothetical protein